MIGFSKLFSFTLLVLSLQSLSDFVQAIRVPNADTPSFHLVSSSASSPNLQPLRMPAGGGGGSASLVGRGTPALFYFYQGQLAVYDPNGNAFPYRPLINTVPAASGCSNFGALQFVQGTSTNKCASYSSFQLQSNQQDSQPGAELVFNFTGGFYACDEGAEAWYKIDPDDGPSDCVPIHLYTVPAY